MMEIYGTIHFKLILPHFPGFLCWGADGTCLRTRMNKINGSEEKNDVSSNFE